MFITLFFIDSMNPFSQDFYLNLELKINEIQVSATDTIDAINKIVEVIEEKITELHNWLKTHSFCSQEEEILFFKEIKPKIVAELIYYNKMLDLEANAPTAKKIKTKYFEDELKEIADYIRKNKIFYQYYRSKATHNDSKYFTRNRSNKLRYYESHIINYDTRVSTSHDYNAAMIKANDLIVNYLESKIEQLKNKTTNQNILTKNTMQWTGNKIDLVELIYALNTQKVFNNGKSDIKEIASYFSKIFNIDVEEGIYRGYLDIKSRKITRTKFLNSLSENLNNRITNEDL
ncbi:MAG: RteC domain-containing protein [Flavobacteriaceae bacterium]|nr:RteC domain-containing protein [Flavobacteriaceae bacterium]